MSDLNFSFEYILASEQSHSWVWVLIVIGVAYLALQPNVVQNIMSSAFSPVSVPGVTTITFNPASKLLVSTAHVLVTSIALTTVYQTQTGLFSSSTVPVSTSMFTSTTTGSGYLSSSTLSSPTVYDVALVLVQIPSYPATPRQIHILQDAISVLPSAFAQAAANLATVEASGPFIVDLSSSGSTITDTAMEASKIFYASNPDTFDFLIIATTYGMSAQDQFLLVSNNVRGIGLSLFSSSLDYGSSSRLQGVAWLGPIDFGRTINDEEYYATKYMVHELGHRWSAFIAFMDNGVKSYAMLTVPPSGHWSQFLNTGESTMGGGKWTNNGDGTFSTPPAMCGSCTPSTYGVFYSLDLYLQGLIAANEVPPTLLVVPTNPDTQVQDGITITGTAKMITID